MKSYSKGILVGISIGLVSILFMGSTNHEVQTKNNFVFHPTPTNDGWGTGVLLNKETGETWYLHKRDKTKHEHIKLNKK